MHVITVTPVHDICMNASVMLQVYLPFQRHPALHVCVAGGSQCNAGVSLLEAHAVLTAQIR